MLEELTGTVETVGPYITEVTPGIIDSGHHTELLTTEKADNWTLETRCSNIFSCILHVCVNQAACIFYNICPFKLSMQAVPGVRNLKCHKIQK